LNDFFGVVSFSIEGRGKIQDLDLSPFFLNKSLKKEIVKDNNFIFGYLSQKHTSHQLNISQPFLNVDKDICIVVDARIDNKDELIQKLYKVSALSLDISNEELILAAYEIWGVEFAQNLIGDFAIVIWDSNKKQLICTRDRIGIKTLYYHKDNTFFSFATEILPLLNIPNYEHRPNVNSMKQFLQFPTELEFSDTMYENISSLPPAHTLILENGSMTLERYWFPEKIKIDKFITFDEAKKKFYELFQNSIHCRLDTFTSTGVDLSGGLDSSSIIAMAHKNNISPIISCSIEYGDYECDETEYIKSMQNKLNIQNIKINGDKIDFKSMYNIDYIYKLNPVWPNFVNSAVMIPLAERIQEKGINVVLTGLGGDETLTGSTNAISDHFKSGRWYDLFSEIIFHRFNIKIIYRHIILASLSKKQKTFIKNILSSLSFRKKEITKENNSFVNINNNTSLEQIDHLKAITSKYFSFAMNALFLRVFKRYNIEYRHPFYDTRVIEFLLSLPPGYRFKNGTTKRILREAMKDLLPKDIYTRDDKAEFSEVVYDQIQAINLDEFWQNKYITKFGIVTEGEIEHIVRDFMELTTKRDHTIITPLWRLINLEKWYRINFIDNTFPLSRIECN